MIFFVSFSRLGLILLYRMVEKTFQFLILLIEKYFYPLKKLI
ncbi:hypothetical protein M097_4149 [Phocaeicola vulgatus str. 3775 SL(B) 10 (iv)]|uniref:Uncharacterized protein n=1 Tax=Phocaeicola vulgatus str. 3775 SL(B) 10 (iv) TaxID=1339350 RepID=A0A078QVH4_PHOVU|nr:hypothetical protein M097_4149 [Phocaeicola vulgatus str. 3775 SL(B) 10 (iv)]KDS35727.1 hypothetical protein M098_4279 [Phocaeicola vulgatus str. 3775 SR(B) 19]